MIKAAHSRAQTRFAVVEICHVTCARALGPEALSTLFTSI